MRNVNDSSLLSTLRAMYAKLINQEFANGNIELLNHTMTFDGNIEYFDIPGFKSNEKYIQTEIEWYMSQSLDTKEISKQAKIWSMVSDENDKINSNYGFLVFSAQNGNQFSNVVEELRRDAFSRRALMYYTNPWMHYQGGKDHICTIYVSYYIRDKKLHCTVNMRSNDLKFGFLNDYTWQQFILTRMANLLNLKVGTITWQAVNLHLYPRHFNLLENLFEKELNG